MPGVNSTADVNVHTLALQIPAAELTRAAPTGPGDPAAVIGVWTTASRQRVRVWGNWFNGGDLRSGPWTQVSRLGNPLGQRAPHRHRGQGRVEHAAADGGRHGVPELLRQATAAAAAAEPLPGGLSEPGELQWRRLQRPTRYRSHLPHWHPSRGDHPGPGVHQLQRDGREGRHATAQHCDTAHVEPEQSGALGPRRSWVPERPAGVR